MDEVHYCHYCLMGKMVFVSPPFPPPPSPFSLRRPYYKSVIAIEIHRHKRLFPIHMYQSRDRVTHLTHRSLPQQESE